MLGNVAVPKMKVEQAILPSDNNMWQDEEESKDQNAPDRSIGEFRIEYFSQIYLASLVAYQGLKPEDK